MVPSLPRLFSFIAITAVSLSTHVVSSPLSWSSHRGQNEEVNNGSRNLRKLESPNGGQGMERCLREKTFFERVEIGTQCFCKDKTGENIGEDDKGIVLVCSDECAFCNEERTVCGIKSEEALYDVESGSKIGMGQVFEYLKFGPMNDFLSTEQQMKAGDGIVLGIEELDCHEQDIDNEYIMGRCSNCNVYFGGMKCNFCEVTECGTTGSGIFAPIMDCTNIQENAIFDFCSNNVEMEEFSLFQAFHPDQFHKCLPMENLLLDEQQ